MHGVSDEIEQWITGTRGVAQTRILFVRGGRIYVVDSDGYGERQLSDAGLSLSPAWSPDGNTISYSVLGSRGWSIVTKSINGGAARTLPSTTTGLNTTPAFSPDGSTLAYSHGDEAGTDLMLVDVAGGAPRRITVGSRLGQHVAGVQPRRQTNRIHIGARGASRGIHYGCGWLERGAAHAI